MQQIILLIHVLVCLSLIALVLLQHGKGADIGAAFGAGASNTVFGSSGASSFLMKLTGGLAAVFFATSLILGYLAAHQQQPQQFQLPVGQPKSIVVPGQNAPTTTPEKPAKAPKQ